MCSVLIFLLQTPLSTAAAGGGGGEHDVKTLLGRVKTLKAEKALLMELLSKDRELYIQTALEKDKQISTLKEANKKIIDAWVIAAKNHYNPA